MFISANQQHKIDIIGRKYNLRFIILHGSYATSRQRNDSDIDIAVLGHQLIDFGKQLDIYSDLAKVFGDNSNRELDFKTLHQVDPLFRFLVVKDGRLLFGTTTDYAEFTAYAYRDYIDSQDLRDLEKHLVRKNIKQLTQTYA